MSSRRLILSAALFLAAAVAAGCGNADTKSENNAAPAGEQKLKKGGRAMPAPPPIEKVN